MVEICLLRMPVKATPDSANIAVIPCFGLARQKLPYVQTLAGDGNWPIQNGSLEADQSECRHHLFGKAVGRR